MASYGDIGKVVDRIALEENINTGLEENIKAFDWIGAQKVAFDRIRGFKFPALISLEENIEAFDRIRGVKFPALKVVDFCQAEFKPGEQEVVDFCQVDFKPGVAIKSWQGAVSCCVCQSDFKTGELMTVYYNCSHSVHLNCYRQLSSRHKDWKEFCPIDGTKFKGFEHFRIAGGVPVVDFKELCLIDETKFKSVEHLPIPGEVPDSGEKEPPITCVACGGDLTRIGAYWLCSCSATYHKKCSWDAIKTGACFSCFERVTVENFEPKLCFGRDTGPSSSAAAAYDPDSTITSGDVSGSSDDDDGGSSSSAEGRLQFEMDDD